jgi:hypothetical protein
MEEAIKEESNLDFWKENILFTCLWLAFFAGQKGKREMGKERRADGEKMESGNWLSDKNESFDWSPDARAGRCADRVGLRVMQVLTHKFIVISLVCHMFRINP